MGDTTVAAVAVDHRPILSSSVSRVQAKMKAEKRRERERETNFLRDVARITIGRERDCCCLDGVILPPSAVMEDRGTRGRSRLLRIEEGGGSFMTLEV